MKKIIDYVVLADDGSANSTKMPQMVVSWIRQGWQPFGGLCFCAANNSLYQAMVKYEQEIPNAYMDESKFVPAFADFSREGYYYKTKDHKWYKPADKYPDPNPAPDQWERPGEV